MKHNKRDNELDSALIDTVDDAETNDHKIAS